MKGVSKRDATWWKRMVFGVEAGGKRRWMRGSLSVSLVARGEGGGGNWGSLFRVYWGLPLLSC